MRIGADGDADLASLVRLPIESWMFDVAPFHGGLLAAWLDGYEMKVAQLDRNGALLDSLIEPVDQS